MQHVTNVCWTLDNKYIVSASDEMNIRLWKARASEKLGVVSVTKDDFAAFYRIWYDSDIGFVAETARKSCPGVRRHFETEICRIPSDKENRSPSTSTQTHLPRTAATACV